MGKHRAAYVGAHYHPIFADTDYTAGRSDRNRARVVVAISAASPGSVIVRAFAAVAARLSLGELFGQDLSVGLSGTAESAVKAVQ